MDPRRLQRLSEAMREELNEIIGYEMEDPRLGFVTVTDVHVSPDSRSARVMVRIPGDRAAQDETLEALKHAGNFVRHQLAERIDIFRVPDLRFEFDAMVEGSRVDMLLKRVRKGRVRE
jgi:ribosome-binding factor A